MSSSEVARTEEYLRQDALRPWDDMMTHLQKCVFPDKIPDKVYDLGCGAGPMVTRFHKLGVKQVIGVDLDENMIECCKLQCPTGIYHICDIGTEVAKLEGGADGLWASFSPAYFTEDKFVNVLKAWAGLVKPGGWLCIIEIDGLFSAHLEKNILRTDNNEQLKLQEITRNKEDWHVQFKKLDDALNTERGYNCLAGGQLASACQLANLEVVDEKDWRDQELYFDGPAGQAQITAWTSRMHRAPIKNLFETTFGGADNAAIVRENFLDCIKSENHVSIGAVKMVIARRPLLGAALTTMGAL